MLLAVFPFARLSAQSDLPMRPLLAPSGRPTADCIGQRIDDIVVYAEAPSVANLQRVPVLAHLARKLHATTKTEVIKNFLLLQEGDPCVELRRAESARILRAQPFIADAEVYVIPNDRGGVDLEVRTSDEVSIVIGGGLRAKSPQVSFLLLGSQNLAGEGVFMSGAWRDGDGLRDAFTFRGIDNQFLGRAWVLAVSGERAILGGSWRVEGTQPFLTDLQRVAWRALGGTETRYFELRQPNGDTPTLPSQRKYFDFGAIVRVGPPGRLGLFGASITGEDESTGERLLLPGDGRIVDVGPSPRLYPPHHIARANLLWGIRRINFARLQGLDALTSIQDVPLGFQFGMQLGRSVELLGAREPGFFAGSDLYLGAHAGMATLRVQARAEGRHEAGTPWDGVLTTGRVTHYLKFSDVHLNQAIVEWSAGYRQRTPFQLLIGVPDGGVRGYEESTLAGGQRVVGRWEERYVLGQVFKAADAGLAFFTDAGKQWAGDVPFGVNSGIKTSVGFSVLATVPAKSARLWRADFAFPLNGEARRSFTIKITNADRTQFSFKEARDVEVGRELTVPSSIFAWP
jgi:Surface antigen.